MKNYLGLISDCRESPGPSGANIANQQVANFHTVNESPDGDGYSLTLIPAQDIDYKVELELRIRYGSPPPVVTFYIQLNYQFTGASDIYSIRSWANRDSNEPSCCHTALIPLLSSGAN